MVGWFYEIGGCAERQGLGEIVFKNGGTDDQLEDVLEKWLGQLSSSWQALRNFARLPLDLASM